MSLKFMHLMKIKLYAKRKLNSNFEINSVVLVYVLFEHDGVYVFLLHLRNKIATREDYSKHPFPRFHLAFMLHKLLFPFLSKVLFQIQFKVLM